jgi:hypothetical protein
MYRHAYVLVSCLLLAGLLVPATARAEPPVSCVLRTQANGASGQHDLSPDGFWVAVWPATASCPGTALDGQEAKLRQQVQLRAGDDGLHGPIAGPLRIVIEFTSAGVVTRRQFEGRARGSADCSSGLCTVDLHIDARNPRGLKLRGVESFSVDPSTLAVTDFSATLFIHDRELAPD